jgi:hypothetical protein
LFSKLKAENSRIQTASLLWSGTASEVQFDKALGDAAWLLAGIAPAVALSN